MSFHVTLGHGAHRFECAAGESILDAALRAHLDLPYSCCRGVCGSCRAHLVSGDVQQRAPFDGLTPAQREEGMVLLCRCTPLSDVVAEPEFVRVATEKRKRLKTKVFRLHAAADDVTLLTLRLPMGTRAKFKAGQYLRLWLDAQTYREFSMANSPRQNDAVQLHVRHVPGGRFTGEVLPDLKVGDALEIELPFGDFHLRPEARPAILVASGTGFAPIKSMVEAAIAEGDNRPMTLYWGARRREDLYLFDLPREWEHQRPGFRFVPVLSEADADWSGRRGLVHEAVMQDHADLSQVDVYACGVPVMVNVARRDFVALRALPPEAFYCDAFVSGPPPEAATQPLETTP